MEGLYEWIRNITYYLIFITVVTNLLPDKKYEKYFKLFAGMVLILLVLKPLTGGLQLDDKLAYYFESISFQNQAGEFSKEMTDMEGKRLESIIAQYEKAVETDLMNMAETDGMSCSAVKAEIDGDQSSETFGQVVSIRLLVSPEEEAGESQSGKTNGREALEPVAAVEHVTPVLVDEKGKSPSLHSGEKDEVDISQNTVQDQEELAPFGGLRRRIAEYYELEEQGIEIQLENRKR